MPTDQITQKKDTFLETYHLLKLNQEELESLNRQITNEIESVIKNLPTNTQHGFRNLKKKKLPTKRRPEPDGFMSEFCQHSNKN